jgi:hypothetical protein
MCLDFLEKTAVSKCIKGIPANMQNGNPGEDLCLE